ncbi:hypothetical protein GCM10027037_29410 [Mucilaginibacter koreensis]
MAQSKLAARLPGGDLRGSNSHQVVFSYRAGLSMNHDTVTYLRDTLMGKRIFSLVQLGSGEIRRVPNASIRFVSPVKGNNQPVDFKTLAKAQ